MIRLSGLTSVTESWLIIMEIFSGIACYINTTCVAPTAVALCFNYQNAVEREHYFIYLPGVPAIKSADRHCCGEYMVAEYRNHMTMNFVTLIFKFIFHKICHSYEVASGN